MAIVDNSKVCIFVLTKHTKHMTTDIFNENGIANVRDLKEEVQAQYKGCGRGSVVISQDGEVVALIYNGPIPNNKVAEWNATNEGWRKAGHEFFSCHFSSGQILLDRSDVRGTLMKRCRVWDKYIDVNTFGIPVEFFVNKDEVFERGPCSNGGYNYPDGLYYTPSYNQFELLITVSE